MRVLIFLCMLSVPGCVIPGFLHLFRTPCFPGLFAYFIFSPCFDKTEEWALLPHGLLHILILPLMLTFVLHLTPPLLMEAVVYTNLHCLCLTNYHYLFWKDVQKHHNIFRAVQFRKELQLLNKYYNLIHGSVLSVTVAIYVTSNLIAAAYALLGLFSVISLAQFLYFAFFTVDCFLGILIGEGVYKVNVGETSKLVLARIKHAPCIKMTSLIKRYLYSWRCDKIELGSKYYDKETPLNLIDFCFNQIVNILLM